MIIAHNEEKYIRKCLGSITSQSRQPDEIILIAHNCTDTTELIAKEFPAVKTISYKGPTGVVSARIKGFEEATGDIVICTDGDSFVMKNWVTKMTAPFEKNLAVVGVGSPVIYYGTWFRTLSDIVLIPVSYIVKNIFRKELPQRATSYFWGPSMAIRKSAYLDVGGLSKFLEVKELLNLVWWPDDIYLAMLLSKIGKIHTTYRTIVFARIKDISTRDLLKRSIEQENDGDKLFQYLLKS